LPRISMAEPYLETRNFGGRRLGFLPNHSRARINEQTRIRLFFGGFVWFRGS
jgi:hypothetical protein